MKRILSLTLALLLALCLCVPALASAEPSAEPSAAPSGEASGEEAYPKFDEYKEYLYATMMQDPFWQGNEANLRAGLDAATSPLDESIQNFTGSGAVDQAPAGVVFPMTYDAWYAVYGETGETLSVEDAFIEYIHEWLIAEDEINDTMTEEIRENEFMPLVYAWDFTSFPAEMIYSGMLESGVPMTFEEFAAQYQPAPEPAASGEASGSPAPAGYAADYAGWIQYLKDYVAAVPAAQEHLDEFYAAIDAGEFYSFPVDMLFVDTYWGYAAASYNDFIAAGGQVAVPAFDPTLTADAQP